MYSFQFFVPFGNILCTMLFVRAGNDYRILVVNFSLRII